MYSFACQKSTRKAPLFRGAGTNQGLLAPNNPNEVEKSPESSGVPAHRRYSDFGDFSICGAAADFRCILSRVPLDTWCCHGRHSYWSRTRGLTNSDGLRLLIFPQPLGEAVEKSERGPNNSSLFLPQAVVVVVALGCWLRPAAAALFESHWTERKNPPLQKQQRIFWWGAQWDSNPRSPDPQSGALTDYAMGTISMRPKGLEPPAHCLEGSCSIHLSYGRTLLSHWVPVWRQCVSAHAARSIIPYSGDPVKNKFENSRFFFFRVSQSRELTTATCLRPPARSPGQRQRERPAPSAPLPVPAVHR